MIVPADDYWSVKDDVTARDIFSTSTWKKMVEIMMLNRPRVSNEESDAKVARAGLARQTWEDCVNAFANFGHLSASGEDEDQFDQIDTGQEFSSSKVI